MPNSVTPYNRAYQFESFGLYVGFVKAHTSFGEHAHGRVEVSVPFGLSGPAAWHDVSGRTTTSIIRPGYSSILPAHMPHSGEVTRGGEVLVMYLDPEFLRDSAGDSLLGNSVDLTEACTAEDPCILEFGATLKRWVKNGWTPFTEFFVESAATTLATHLLHRYAASGLPLRTSKTGLPPEALRRAIDYVHDRIGDRLSVVDMATVADVSPSYFSRQFKMRTGRTPYAFVLAARLAKARELLRGTGAPISTIALAAGFSDHTHLSRTFRRALGFTPGAYRGNSSLT